jgi:hypothetical protein
MKSSYAAAPTADSEGRADLDTSDTPPPGKAAAAA